MPVWDSSEHFPELNSESLSANGLFVAQGLDGIQPRGAEGRNHAADQPDRSKNQCGHDYRAGSDDQTDVPSLRILGHRAIKREPSYGKRDHVGQNNPQQAADESDGKSFCEELKQDISTARPQGFFYADLPSTLGHRDQHDVHQADSPDSEGQRADEAKQNLQADGDDLELMNLFHK